MEFVKLNDGWNADPNCPHESLSLSGNTLRLRISPNTFEFPEHERTRQIELSFEGCGKYRLGPTNDEGWYAGQCRYGQLAPKWGEFYEVCGFAGALETNDWKDIPNAQECLQRHFLFYLRNNTFECLASTWSKKNVS